MKSGMSGRTIPQKIRFPIAYGPAGSGFPCTITGAEGKWNGLATLSGIVKRGVRGSQKREPTRTNQAINSPVRTYLIFRSGIRENMVGPLLSQRRRKDQRGPIRGHESSSSGECQLKRGRRHRDGDGSVKNLVTA